MLMLGKPFAQAAGRYAGVKENDLNEAFTGDYSALDKSAPFQLIQRFVVQ